MMNIKKTILSLILLSCFSASYNAQDINFGDFSKPVPSVSSLAAYTNTAVSYATGIPDISIPLLNLPTNNKNINLNLNLSYNPLNVAPGEAASDVGTGWSLFMGGVISRKIVDELDEKYDDTSNGNYHKNAFNDIYYYNLPGISGKFKIERGIGSDTFSINNLSSNLVKIEYTRESNTATLILNSFTITDTKGIQYIFNDYSLSNSDQNSFFPGGKVYKSAFFLSQIKDANNTEVANFSYQKDTRYKMNYPGFIDYKSCKLKTINSPFYGKIELDYLYDSTKEKTMNDPYSIDKVKLKDHYNHIISQYAFEYSERGYDYFNGTYTVNTNKRILTKLKKLNRNNAVSENTEFQYNSNEYEQFVGDTHFPYGYNLSYFCPEADLTKDPRKAGLGVLKRIINPTGGVVEYNFEPQEMYVDKSTPDYLNPIINGESFINPQLQYLKEFKQFSFDTNHNTTHLFSIVGTAGVKKRIYVHYTVFDVYTPIFWDANSPTYVDFSIKQGNQAVLSNGVCPNPIYSGTNKVEVFDLLPGSYEFKLAGSGGNGNVIMYDIGHIPLPFKNKDVTTGLRIADIKYYENKTASAPIKISRYAYDSFTDSNSSSGFSFSPEDDYGTMIVSNFTLYKNVKVTNADDNIGYTKYYYKTPNDYPYYFTGSNQFWPYYNLTKNGMAEKQEIYNAQNQLLASAETEYIMDNIPAAQDYLLMGTNTYSKTAYYKKITEISKSYLDNQVVEQKEETEFNESNMEASVIKKTYDDTVTETKLTYPSPKSGNYIALGLKNIIGIPVITETKDNGILISKSETKFDNPSSTFPTSMLATNVSDGSTKTAGTFDLYDEQGNLLQSTSAVGIPNAIVYGYDKTQPIARIQGATYAQVAPYIQAIVDASNADAANPANEQTLLTALDNFRQLSVLQNMQITTYTYDPLIGVTTSTPPNGIRAIYKYDANNRLEKVVDMNGVTLKEYEYNYKN